MSEKKSKNLSIDWQGIEIQLTYWPRWSHLEAGELVSLVQIQSINPNRARLPITETGYLSHFFYTEKALPNEEIRELVIDWLDEEAESKAWKDRLREGKQFTLF